MSIFDEGVSAEALLRQASYTADNYMECAISDIDKCFGEGFARNNPDLVAVYMKVAAMDFSTSMYLKSKGCI